MGNWRKYIFENDDKAAANIMLGANYGGRAINITATTAAHAMSYKITSLYKFPHGHAVAVCLPEIWEFMISNMDKCRDARGLDYLDDIFNKIAKAMGAGSPTEAIAIFRVMMKEMEMANPISDSNQRNSDLEVLSSSVNPVRLKNNPIQIDVKVALQLYSKIID